MNDEEINNKTAVDNEELQKTLDAFEGVSELYKWVIEDIIDEAEDYEDGDTDGVRTGEALKKFLDDLTTKGGCQSGFVSSLIYTPDCVEIFNTYEADIYDYLEDLETSYGSSEEMLKSFLRNLSATDILMGTDTVKTYVVWTAYEGIANQLYDEIYNL